MNRYSRKLTAYRKPLSIASTFCAGSIISISSLCAPLTFHSTSEVSQWQVATNVGGAEGAFVSFPTDGFVNAVTVSGRMSEGVNWIANNSTGTNGCCVGLWTFFVFRQTFDLTGYDSATANLEFQWAADDSGEGFADRGVWTPKYALNGGSLINGTWNTGSTYSFGSATDVSNGFVDGLNIIDFYVQGNGITDGFALKTISLTAGLPEPVPVPEPASVGLILIGLGVIGYRSRLRRRRPFNSQVKSTLQTPN